MLISLKEMLAKAREEQFAVGAFNTTDLKLVRAVIEEAEPWQDGGGLPAGDPGRIYFGDDRRFPASI